MYLEVDSQDAENYVSSLLNTRSSDHHRDSSRLSFDDVILLLTVFEMLLCSVFGCVFILPFYFTTLILSRCEILF